MKRRCWLAVFSLMTMTSGAVGAQNASEIESIITDRPDFTESTETVPVGMTQIEAGVTFARFGNERSRSLGEVLVRQSLGRKTELRLELPTRSSTRSREFGGHAGFEDMAVGFKTMLSQGSGKMGLGQPRVSLIGATSLPTGSRNRRSRRLQPEVKLLMGWDLSENTALSSNINYAYLSDDGKRFGELGLSLSLAHSLSEKVGSYVEVFGFVPNGDRASSRYINGGFTYLVNPNFQLDARLGFGLSNDVDGADNFFGFGAARRF